jgi:pimeloyl-ACP methyl ester carboxylesterase
VVGNGFAQTCLRWPPTPAPAPPRSGDLPPVPTLLLAGDRDLSTPLPWAREQAAHTPRGRLVVVHRAGHSVQSRAPGGRGRRAVQRFLLG